jgi:hypothetical protein
VTLKTRLAVLFISVCLLAVGLLMVLSKSAAAARPAVPPPVYAAVRAYWKTAPQRIQAFDVIACETGGAYNTTAVNGEHVNLFQMGYNERRTYGWHVAGSPARLAARAAHRYWLVAGWRPWSQCT